MHPALGSMLREGGVVVGMSGIDSRSVPYPLYYLYSSLPLISALMIAKFPSQNYTHANIALKETKMKTKMKLSKTSC